MNDFAEERDNSLISRVRELAYEGREELEKSYQDLTVSLSDLKKCINELENLPSTCAKIDDVAMSLRVVGLNMGIEGSKGEIIDFNNSARGWRLHK